MALAQEVLEIFCSQGDILHKITRNMHTGAVKTQGRREISMLRRGELIDANQRNHVLHKSSTSRILSKKGDNSVMYRANFPKI